MRTRNLPSRTEESRVGSSPRGYGAFERLLRRFSQDTISSFEASTSSPTSARTPPGVLSQLGFIKGRSTGTQNTPSYSLRPISYKILRPDKNCWDGFPGSVCIDGEDQSVARSRHESHKFSPICRTATEGLFVRGKAWFI